MYFVGAEDLVPTYLYGFPDPSSRQSNAMHKDINTQNPESAVTSNQNINHAASMPIWPVITSTLYIKAP